MTDDTTETLAPQTFKDDFQRLQFEQINNFISQRNSVVGLVNAASGDRVTLTEQIRENSQDPEIVAAREAAAEAEMRLHALVTPLVEKIIEDSKGSIDEAENKLKELDGIIKPSQVMYKKIYGDDAANYFSKLDRVKGASVGRGSGVRRIRGFNVILTVDGENTEYENFASAAGFLDLDTTELQKAFFEKAGTDVLKDLPDTVSFTINYVETDADGNSETKDAFVKAYRKEGTETEADETITGTPESSGEAAETVTPGEGVVDENDLENLV